MITSTVDICNMALDYCNIRNITSLEEETKQSKVCSRWYDTVRKSLLLNINASFSIKRAILAEAADYTSVYGYNKAWALPSDCLQVLIWIVRFTTDTTKLKAIICIASSVLMMNK